jgi:hypothetical protein
MIRSLWYKYVAIISGMNLHLAIASPGMIGLIVGLLLPLIFGKPLYGSIYQIFGSIVILFFLGLTGVNITIRKEIPVPFFKCTGLQPIIIGIFMALFCWGFAVYGLIAFFLEY